MKKKKKGLIDWSWIITVAVTSSIISALLSVVSEVTIPKVNLIFQILIVIIFVAISILFDMISIAVTTASESPFHSMSSQKIKSANVAIVLLKNRDKIASLSADVIGDVCGIVTGALGVTISIGLANLLNLNTFISSLIVTSFLSALTIGGKAIFKPIALSKNKTILIYFSKILTIFYRPRK